MTPPDSSSLLRQRSFVLYWGGRTSTTVAYAMQTVAVGWQIYDLTGSALDLGLVGLVQFVPILLMSLVVGQVADHFDRRVIVCICQVVKALAVGALALGTLGGWLGRDSILAILFVTGAARAFEVPTLHTLIPSLVPQPLLLRAIAASSSANQTAVIVGPALGGLIYLIGPATVYATCTVAYLAASVLIGLMRPRPRTSERGPVNLASLLAGFAYIRGNPVLLGVITLDLFAVLVSGVTGLLPIFARDVLATGPAGLGLLRSAPAVGALAMAVYLAHSSLEHRIGVTMFASVAVFSLSIIVFALSASFVLSLAALIVYGASDAISVVIRQSLVQTRTPNEMLGRVSAVNSMCTGTSGTLGDFRAGAVAAAIGAVPSVLIGGIAALAITLAWMRLFPVLLRVNRLSASA
jgi:MFS family permease